MELFTYLMLLLLSVALAPKPPRPKSASLEDFDLPTASEDRSVPVAFGTPIISGPNLVWYGDLDTSPIRKSSGFTKTTVGYRYYLGMHFALSHRVDALEKILIGERLAWSGDLASGTGTIDAGGLFGGSESEGGISGDFDLLDGNDAQAQNSYLLAQLGADLPSFIGVSTLVWKGGYVGTTPYLKPWSFVVRRTQIQPDGTAQWQSALASISGQMNPAHILREVYTQPWGLAWPETAIDDAAFLSAAQTLYDEGFGLSMQWVNSEPVEAFAARVLEMIDGVRVEDRATGKLGIRLIRDDYNPATVPVFDETNVISLDRFERRAWGDTVNEIKLTWTDPSRLAESVLTVQDLGNIRLQGRPVAENVSYPAIQSQAIAARVASRLLRSRAAPLSKVELVVDRSAWDINRGDAVRLSWSSGMTVDAIYRVIHLDRGELTDGRITLHLIEDVFALPDNVHLVSEPQSWSSPNTTPAAMAHTRIVEAAYWDLAQAMDPANIAALPAGYAFPLVVAGSDVGDLFHYVVQVSPDAADTYSETVTGYNAAYATLAAGISKTATEITLSGLINERDLETGDRTYLLIDDEKLRLDSLNTTTGVAQVARGLLDSVPATHSLGAEVWFMSQFGVLEDQTGYTAGTAVDVKLVPTTSLGELALASAPKLDVSLTQFIQRPYPAANLRIQSNYYPSEFTAWVIPITWQGRDRLTDTGDLVADSATSGAPESGTVFTVEIYDQTLTLLESAATTAQQYDFNNIPHAATALTVRVKATRDGIAAAQYPEVTVSNGAPAFPDPYGDPAYIQAMYPLSYYEANDAGLTISGTGDYLASFAVVPGALVGDVFTEDAANYLGFIHTGDQGGASAHSDLGNYGFNLFATFDAESGTAGETITVKDPVHFDSDTPTEAAPWIGRMNGEIFLVTGRSGNTLTAKRGIFGSYRMQHTSGDVMHLVRELAVDTRAEYAQGLTVNQYVLPYDQFAPTTTGETTELAHLVAGFQHKPALPGNWLIEGETLDNDYKSAVNTLSMTWRHRSRVTVDAINGYDDDLDETPEGGTTYVFKIYDISGGGSTLKDTVSSAGKTLVYDLSVSPISNTAGAYEVQCHTERSSVTSALTMTSKFIIGISPEVWLLGHDNTSGYHGAVGTLNNPMQPYQETSTTSGVMDSYDADYLFSYPKQRWLVSGKWYGVGWLSSQASAAYLLRSAGTDPASIEASQILDSGVLTDLKSPELFRANNLFFCCGYRPPTAFATTGPLYIYQSSDLFSWTLTNVQVTATNNFRPIYIHWDSTNTRYVIAGTTVGSWSDASDPTDGPVKIMWTTDWQNYTTLFSLTDGDTRFTAADSSGSTILLSGYAQGSSPYNLSLVSTDDGATWTNYSSTLEATLNTAGNAFGGAVPFVTGGVWSFTDENVCVYSTTSGSSWLSSTPTAGTTAQVSLDTLSPIKKQNGDIVLRYTQSTILASGNLYVQSTDGGATWSALNDYF